MSGTTKQTKLMSALALCAVLVALISFFLPLFSVSFFGTHSQSAMDVIMESSDFSDMPELGVVLSLGCTVLSLVFSFLSLKMCGAGAGTIVTSVLGMIMMMVAMSDDSYYVKLIDYAAVGFYLYEAMCGVAVVLSLVAMITAKSADSAVKVEIADARTVVPAPASVPGPVPAPIKVSTPSPTPAPKIRTICAKCSAELDKEAVFCRFCGTPTGKKAPAPVPTPAPAPASAPTPKPVPAKKNEKVICSYCGARHKAGTETCQYCGTAITGDSKPGVPASSVFEDPVPVPAPKPATATKATRKAICPKCGARQSEENVKCKYCGTSMR